jgi:hypothetical protein
VQYHFSPAENRAKILLINIYQDIDPSPGLDPSPSPDQSSPHIALASTCSVWAIVPLLPFFIYFARVLKWWASKAVVTAVQLHHVQIAENKKHVALNRLFMMFCLLFLLSQAFWLIFYVTELAAAHAHISSYALYRSSLAERYLSLSFWLPSPWFFML